MKRLLLLFALHLVLSMIATCVVAQKEMQLDEDFVKNSTPMIAKPKGIGSVTKYQFGPYRIASGKEGITTTTSKSGILSANSKSKSKRKLSFVFVKDEKDSVVVNVSVDTDISELNATMAIGFSMVNSAKENYMAIFTMPSDTTTWRMMIGSLTGTGVKDGDHFKGVLTDGNSTIEIRDVDQWNTGKKASFGVAIGHTFHMQDKSIAAVQASPDTFVKKTVWIRHDVDSRLQLILAAASAALMVRVEQGID
jgi:hypothetical protein